MRSIIKLLFISFLFVFIAIPSDVDAQIWKKIKDRTKDKIEDRAAEKISDKIAEIVIGKMSEKLQSDTNPYKLNLGTKISKPENLPEEYNFDWKYRVKMTSNSSEDEIVMDYMLPQDESYFGYNMPESENMFSVVDFEQGTMISYMEDEGNSFAISHDYPTINYDEMVEDDESSGENIEVTELPSKRFAGFDAKGYQYETDKSTMVVYITEDAEVTFSGFGAIPGQAMPTTYGLQMGKKKGALMLYMKFTDKSNPENVMEMECLELKKEYLSKKNKEYNFL
jgi:hypothetical protein